MIRRMKHALALVLLMAAASALAQERALPAWAEALDTRFATQARVNVLIEARTTPPALPGRERASAEGPSAMAERARNTVSEATRPLAADVTGREIAVRHVYAYQPLILADVSREGLRQLAERNDVAAVYENTYIDMFEPVDPVGRTSPSMIEREALEREPLERERPELLTSTPVIGADRAWSLGYRGQGFSIAVLDTGINASHEMFRAKIAAEGCFSDGTISRSYESLCPGGVKATSGPGTASLCPGARAGVAGVCEHGSHVAAIAAGDGGSGPSRMRGVAPEAKLIPVQVFTRTTGCPTCLGAWTSDLVAAVDWLVSVAPTYGLAAVNMSLGGAAFGDMCSGQALERGIQTLRQMGILTIIASGNDGRTGSISFPACIKDAVSVGSVSRGGVPSYFSNVARTLDLLAPGEAVNAASMAAPGGYATYSGTSMATPHVAGAVAVLKSKLPTASADQLEHALKEGGVKVTIASWTWATARIVLANGSATAALDILGQSPPPPGVTLAGLLPGAHGAMRSLLRIANPNEAALSVSVVLMHGGPAKPLGTFSASVPGYATRQFAVKDMEAAIGSAAAADASLLAVVNANAAASVQHILTDAGGGIVSNVTVCSGGAPAMGAAKFMANLHTAAVADMPSHLVFYNAGSRTASPSFRVYDAASGAFLGSVATGSIAPRSAYAVTAADLFSSAFNYANPDFLRGGGRTPFVNLERRAEFEGMVTHTIAQPKAGTLTDMTTACVL